MNVKLKKGLKITGIIFAVVIVLMLLLPFAFKGKIVDVVKKEANKMLNAKLDFEELDLSFFRHFPNASVELNGLSLSGIGDFENDTLISVKSVEMAVDLLSLFGDQGYKVNYIVLDEPSVKAVKLQDGRVNWDIMKPDTASAQEKPDTVSSSSFKLKLKQFKIKNATIAYVDDSTKMQFYTRDLDLKLSGDMSSDVTDIDSKLSCKDIYFSLMNVPYLKNASAEMKLTVNADFSEDKYTFKENSIKLNAIELNLDGWLALLDDGMDMDITLNTPKIQFKDILSLVPAIYQNDFDKLKTSGNIELNAFAKGRMAADVLPEFDISLQVKDGMFSYEGMPKTVDHIVIGSRIYNPGGIADRTTISVDNFSFSMAGNPFKLTLFASTPASDLNFKATASGTLNLNLVKDIFPLGDSIQLNGIIHSDLRFAGKMSDIENERYQNIQGEGNFTVADMVLTTVQLPKLEIREAVATVTPRAMTLSSFDVILGKSDIQAKGTLSNYLAYFLKDELLTGTLTVTSTLLDLNELMQDGTDAAAPETRQTDSSTVMSAFEVPKNLNLTMNADLKKILFQKMILTDVTGRLFVSGGSVRMAPIGFNAFGGKVLANGSYSTAVNALRPVVDFDLKVSRASFEQTFEQLDMIQKIVPIFSKTGGTYSVDFKMNMPLNSEMSPELNDLTAKGTLQSNDIKSQNIEVFGQLASLLKNDKFKNIEAKDIKISFTIEDGKLQTSPFDLKFGNININFSGATGLDQTIDYVAKITLPSGTAGGMLSSFSAHIGGTFAKPALKLNTADAVKDAVKSTVASKLLGADNHDIEAQKEAIRKKAEEAGNKLVETARTEGDKLIEKAKNPLAKIAAQTAAKKLLEEAEKQAGKLKEEAEKVIEKEYGPQS